MTINEQEVLEMCLFLLPKLYKHYENSEGNSEIRSLQVHTYTLCELLLERKQLLESKTIVQ